MHEIPPKKRLFDETPPWSASFRTHIEDFRVFEIPAYPLEGKGDHLFVHFEKRGLTTAEAVRRLCRSFSVSEREVGIAGQKDKNAITQQWVSFFGVDPELISAFETAPGDTADGISILEATRHTNKLRTGHLAGNRFEIVLRDCEIPPDEVEAFAERLDRLGIANYFGVQRFRDPQLLDKAIRWLRGEERPPRNKRVLKWWMSTIQSALFNAWLSERIDGGLLDKALKGDVLKKVETGGIFNCEDAAVDSVRAASWELSCTGPIWGAKMRMALDEAGAREEALLGQFDLTFEDIKRNKKAGAGTRRVGRIRPKDFAASWQTADTLKLTFELPKGSYATELLRELLGREPEMQTEPASTSAE